MIFIKKGPMQGNFIFADGTLADFSKGYYETDKAVQQEQLKGIYDEADGIPADIEAKAVKKVEAAAAITGTANSAKLAPLAKTNS